MCKSSVNLCVAIFGRSLGRGQEWREVWDIVLLNRVLSTDVILLKDIFTKAPLSIPMTFLQIFCPILLSVRTLICRHGVKCALVLPKIWT